MALENFDLGFGKLGLENKCTFLPFSKTYDFYMMRTLIVYPFYPTGPFQYPLKMSENQRFFHIFRRHIKRPVAWNRLMLNLDSFIKKRKHSVRLRFRIESRILPIMYAFQYWLLLNWRLFPGEKCICNVMVLVHT